MEINQNQLVGLLPWHSITGNRVKHHLPEKVTRLKNVGDPERVRRGLENRDDLQKLKLSFRTHDFSRGARLLRTGRICRVLGLQRNGGGVTFRNTAASIFPPLVQSVIPNETSFSTEVNLLVRERLLQVYFMNWMKKFVRPS